MKESDDGEYVSWDEYNTLALKLSAETNRADSEAQRAEAYKLRIAALDESIAGCARKIQAVAAERDAARAERIEMEQAIAEREDYELCDTCGNLSTETTDTDDDGSPLGHVQCAQCSRMASLEHDLSVARQSLYEVVEQRNNAMSRLEKTENQNRFLRSWIRELREDGADAVSVDPLYGMLLDRITELATADPAADSPEGAQLTALADLCEAYEQRRGESAAGIAVEKQCPVCRRPESDPCHRCPSE